jgi:hypothetical protein
VVVPRGVAGREGRAGVNQGIAIWRSLLPVGWLLLVAAGGAEAALFESSEPLVIELRGPIRSMSLDRDVEPRYRDAMLGFHGADGAWREVPIQVRPRGKSRRDRTVCTFPPLSIKLPTPELAGTVFENQTRLKLTTHCQPSPRHERYVYKEYLAYRMLNVVSDLSFRVQAVQVTYVDIERKGRREAHPGFFVEDKDLLALRLGLGAQPERVYPDQLDPGHASLMELFELMIGNTDFSFIALPTNKPCCHNSVAYVGPTGAYLPLPYDFDISGFVNPPYAVPDHRLPIDNVRQRLYRGFCREGAAHQQAVARMQEVRPALFELLGRETPLDDRSRKEVIAFVNGFYAILDDPQRLDRMVFRACSKGSARPDST